MKICKKCGAVQDDTRSTCIDCGELLPSVLTDEDKKAMQKQLDMLSDKSEGVYFPLWVKLVTLANFLLLVGAILYCCFEKVSCVEYILVHIMSVVGSVLMITEDKLKKLFSAWLGGWWFDVYDEPGYSTMHSYDGGAGTKAMVVVLFFSSLIIDAIIIYRI